ncbi:phosphoenolpyruvate synthase regulatory protein [Pueribacillus theae]|uniref:Putative pyruvate, phosphate dikinase regulatory protein n=1 Tax=Pueribacillus theae TaxID=2171751 RepID=A0A2U1K4K5_9BACI|nr:pyruvate, water dikinase regulatory protein [Pueribacillus theae]PWA12460.1 phosphoenolpyruvate synthase regulatory protein [Pueribacillus theae]
MTDNHNGRVVVYVISDSVGETADLVVKAAASQFQSTDIEVRRVPYVEDRETVREIVSLAKEAGAIIAFTLVLPEIKKYLLELAEESKVKAVDIIGPMMNTLESLIKKQPLQEPGLVHKLDEEYFRKIEAIEFAVKYDDGRDPRGILRADIVLIGVSRTSKTPLSQYLALKRLKVANVPIVPEVRPPEELFKVPVNKCIGLKISPEKLNHIRKERLKALGLNADANYAKLDRIKKELAYFDEVTEKIGCGVIDVSNKAVEETANLILKHYKH